MNRAAPCEHWLRGIWPLTVRPLTRVEYLFVEFDAGDRVKGYQLTRAPSDQPTREVVMEWLGLKRGTP